jgi:hypothetical protein
VNTNVYKRKRPTPPSTIGMNIDRKNHNILDIEQIYDNGSQLGLIPGMTVPADCRHKHLLLQELVGS